jgi:hypothetical protein
MKIKIALFQYAFETGNPSEVKTEDEAKYTSAVCVSEWIEVDFPMLSQEVQVPLKVAALDKEIAEETENFAAKIHRLNSCKNELLAITYVPADGEIDF